MLTWSAGLVLLLLAMLALDAVGAPGWIVLSTWLVPTLAVIVWAVVRPRAADRNDDDHGWIDYATTRVLIGDETPRPAPVRVATGLVAGGPLGWVFLLGLAAELAGVI